MLIVGVFYAHFCLCMDTAAVFGESMQRSWIIAMRVRFQSFLPITNRRICGIFLAIVWVIGLALGAVLSMQAGDRYFLLMRWAADRQVSIVGFLASAFLPFMLSALAVYISKPILLYGICFADAFLLSLCGCVAMTAFGSAGWLVRLLLQFSDCCMAPILFWFSIRCISGSSFWKDFSLCAVISALVGSIDYCFVSPFLVMLIEI